MAQATLHLMSGPDFSRGSGWGTPEQKMDLIRERRDDEIREAQAAHVAHELRESDKARGGRLPWYRRLFRRPAR